MIDSIDHSIKQEDDSCSVAITGLAYNSNYHLYDNDYSDLNSILIQLSKDALADDQPKKAATINENLNILVCNSSTANLITAPQLFSSLGLRGQGFDKKVSNPLQGLEAAFNQLQSSRCNVILLVFCDLLENTSALQSSYYLSAFVLRPLTEAIASDKKVYASIPLLCKTNNEDLSTLEANYKSKQISTSSINLLTLGSKSQGSLIAKTTQLSDWFAKDARNIEKADNVKQDNALKEETWCSLQIVNEDDKNHSLNLLSSLVDTIISIQQRRFLPITKATLIEQIDLKHSPFYFNLSVRPWFHPQIHPQFRSISPQPAYIPSLRRAALHIMDDATIYHMVAEECEDVEEVKRRDLQPEWPSEIFVFFAENRYQLIDYLRSIEAFTLNYRDQINLKDLAFSVDRHTTKLINESLSNTNNLRQQNSKDYLRAAFVCASIEELLSKIKSMINSCLEGNLTAEGENVYWRNPLYNNGDSEKNKLAFILPGLGAAYPNMLAELCLHFPEIRAIFDFVDYLSVAGGSKLRPSDRVFCRLDPRTKTFRETPASLAVMDSGVISVLMAEWAIFTLLLNLDIVPDILLGSSTGEFAALTMSGAVDIFKAAPLFYHLSTGMANALPLEQLINLRSLRVNDSYEKIATELAAYKDKVYLSANLSPQQLILTGDRESINSLLASFESRNISADFLPFAIPYHTSLVANVVSADNPDIEALQISTPLIESWSCSLAAPYPNKAEKIKKMTTDLFSKPILFRESIEALYKDGVRHFVEVGPRGSLAPVISETLQSRPHVSLAANRSDISAITQLQNVLSSLFVNDIFMDLSYLYARRSTTVLPLLLDQYQANNESTSTKIENYAPPIPAEQFSSAAPDIFSITRSFQKQLQELEKQVMAVLMPDKSKIATLIKDPSYLSSTMPLAQIFPSLLQNNSIVCRRLLEQNLPTDERAFTKLIETVLTPIEQNQLHAFNRPSKRREWLAGRMASKEAARSLIANLTGVNIENADIEIAALSSGKPYITKLDGAISGAKVPVISITHKDGQIIAVAADASTFSAIGIDLESQVLDDDLEDLILNSTERDYLKDLSGQERTLNIKKIWSAKEAVAKLLGLALPECLTKISVTHIEANASKYRISVNQDAAFAIEHNQYLAHVACLDETILSLVML